MKNVLIVLSLLFFFGCKTMEKSKSNKTFHTHSVKEDSTKNTTNNNLSAEITYESNNIEDNKLLVGMGNAEISHRDIRIIEVNNTKVLKQHSNLSDGRIIYKIPDVMKVRSTYKVLVRISKSKSTISIFDSLSGDVKTSLIPITETMEVELIDLSPQDKKAFEIVNENNGVQIIENDDSYTEWSWSVTPIRVGKSKLEIIVSIIRNGNKKDIVYEDSVEIERDIREQIIFFWEEYWKWIISTFILPFIIWWWKNRKKKKSTDKEEEIETEEEDGKGEIV